VGRAQGGGKGGKLMAAVAQLKALLGMDNSQYKAKAKESTDVTSRMQGTIANTGKMIAGAFSVGAIVGFTQRLIEWASELSETAQSLNLTTAELMSFNRSAVQSDVDVKMARRAIVAFKETISDAINGSEQARGKLDKLNLSLADLAGMDTPAQMNALAVAAMATGTPLTAIAEIVGGRLAPAMTNLIRTMAEGDTFSQLSRETGEYADRLELLGDRLGLLGEQNKTFWAGMLSGVMNVQARVTDFLGGALSQLQDNLKRAGEAFMKGDTLGAGGAILSSYGTGDGGVLKAGFTSANNGAAAEDAKIAARRDAADQARADEIAANQAKLAQQVATEEAAAKSTVDKAIEENERLVRARLEGEDKINAEALAAVEKLQAEKLAAEKAGERELAALLFERMRIIQAQRVADIDELRKKEADAAQEKAASEAKAAADAKARRLDPLMRDRENILDRMAEIKKPGAVNGQDINFDAYARMGGMIGSQRVGMNVADRESQIAAGMTTLAEELRANTAAIRDANQGGG